MKPEEAIKWQEAFFVMNTLDEGMQACKTAISALKKQLPQKPCFLRMLGDRTYKAKCNCGQTFVADLDKNQNVRFCPNCGQALDWGKEE